MLVSPQGQDLAGSQPIVFSRIGINPQQKILHQKNQTLLKENEDALFVDCIHNLFT